MLHHLLDRPRFDRAYRRREEHLRVDLGRTPEQWAPVRHRAREVFDGLPVEGKRVLDVGAGIGTYALYLTRVLGAAEAVALEPSAGIGGHADIGRRLRARLEAAGEGRVSAVEQTFQSYAPSAPFDVVVLLNSINHLHETRAELDRHPTALDAYRRAFARLHDWLAPGGLLLVNELDRTCLERYTSRLGLPRVFTQGIDYDLHQPPGTWARLAREAGFGAIEVHGVTPRRLRHLPSAIGRHRWTRFATNAMFVMRATRR